MWEFGSPHFRALWLCALGCACTARISGAGDSASLPDGTRIGGTNSPASGTSTPEDATATRVMRRLTRFEYDNTIRDLLGQQAKAAREFPHEEMALGFDNNAEALMFPAALADQAFSKAEALATKAVEDKLRFAPCAATETSAACALEFIAGFGTRALRRPLTESETAQYVDLFGTAADFDRGLALVVTSMLISLPFFYRMEGGSAGDAAYGTAARLSYALWGSLPDDALLESARTGRLASSADLEREAARLMDDERSHPSAARFHALWLGLDGIGTANKDPTLFAGYASELLPKLRGSIDRFLDQVAFQGGGFSELLLANHTYADERLAAFYGFDRAASADPATLVFVRLPGAESAGLLSQPGLLAMLAGFQATSPTRRGAFVRTRLLCDPPQPPPADVDITPPAPSATGSRRAQTQAHAAAPACRGCHDLLDPIGFGFEAYDASGRYRMLENAASIDVTGAVNESPIGEFSGLGDLAQKLAVDPQAVRCFATQWFRFLSGRKEQSSDAAVIDRAVTALGSNGSTGYRELLLSLVTSPTLSATPPSEP